jgi:predicted transposase YbfD/YdcC
VNLESNPNLTSNLHHAFQDLEDPRATNSSHPLINIIVIALLAVIAGANDFTEFEEYGYAKQAFLARFLDLSNGIPSHDTFLRTFAKLNPTSWQTCCLDWVRGTIKNNLEQDHIAIDGKVLRGSNSDDDKAVCLVNAWSTRLGLCLTQTTVSQKSNEITALPHVIETLALFDLTGCIITIDAMGAQREVARLLIEKHALYVLALKDNQAKLAEDVRWLFDDAFKHNFQGVPHDFFETQEQAHGRNEIRRCWVLSELSYLEHHNWPGLERVVLIESERTVKGVTSVERRFYLSAVTEGAEATLSTVRAHWGVENSLHWVLDVIFAEDAHQVRADHAAANLGVLRRWALNLLRLTPSPRKNMSLKNKRNRAGWDDSFLELVLAQL